MINDTSSQKTAKMMPVNPTAKPPLTINMAVRTGDLEDDREANKPQDKPVVKNPQQTGNTSPQIQTKQETSPERSPTKQADANLSPKKEDKLQVKPVQPGPHTGQSSNLSKSTMLHHHEEDAPVYNPYNDIKAGKSEEEALGKLKQENTKLRQELKSISEDLTVLLDKKKMEKKEKDAPRVGEIVANATVSEQVLVSELELAQKKLAQYQKEIAAAKEKYEVHATYERFQGLQDHLYEMETKIQDMTSARRNVEKALREKEKQLDSVVTQSNTNTDVIALDENARYYREKVRDGERKKEQFEKLAQKRKEFAAKLQEEITTMKKDYQRIQQKTGYEHKEVPKSEGTKRNSVPEEIKKKIPISKHIEEELACTLENFEKLKKEIKVIERAEELREKKGEREFEDMSEQIQEYERSRDEAFVKIAERKKEIELLQTKLRDLSRIVRHQALAPLQREEELALKEASEAQAKLDAIPAGRRHVKAASKKESILPKKPQPYHLLVEYAKHNFNSKGYRKDEKGKVLRDDEGTNFNDKDVVGKQRVKIIAMDVWHDDNCINGISGIYENEAGDMIEGGAHVLNADQSKLVTFETLEEDYIKEISGFINKTETAVECLIMRTFRGEIMKVGTASKDSKLFKFDINELEYPAMFYGSIKEEKNGPSKLARLGVLIATQTIEEKLNEEKKAKNAENKKGEEQGEKEEGEDRGNESGDESGNIKEKISGGESRRSEKLREINK